VREALFMILGPLDDLRVVDLYAGSGALGIEALSRGASFVEFVEGHREALRALSANLKQLQLEEHARVWNLLLPGGLARLDDVLADVDLVLADPPYGGEDARATLETLGRPGTLRRGCRVVLEHHGKDELPEHRGDLVRTDVRRYGETHLTFYGSRDAASLAPEESRT